MYYDADFFGTIRLWQFTSYLTKFDLSFNKVCVAQWLIPNGNTYISSLNFDSFYHDGLWLYVLMASQPRQVEISVPSNKPWKTVDMKACHDNFWVPVTRVWPLSVYLVKVTQVSRSAVWSMGQESGPAAAPSLPHLLPSLCRPSPGSHTCRPETLKHIQIRAKSHPPVCDDTGQSPKSGGV